MNASGMIRKIVRLSEILSADENATVRKEYPAVAMLVDVVVMGIADPREESEGLIEQVINRMEGMIVASSSHSLAECR